MAKYSWPRMITAEVLPRLPELRLTRSVLHTVDTDWLLCGAVEMRSLFSRAFTVEVLVMPLYVPADHVGWLVGERLGRLTSERDIWWDPATTSESELGADVAARLASGAHDHWRRFGDVRALAAECRRHADVRDRPPPHRDRCRRSGHHGRRVRRGGRVRRGAPSSTRVVLAAARAGPPRRPGGDVGGGSGRRCCTAARHARPHGGGARAHDSALMTSSPYCASVAGAPKSKNQG